MPIATRRASGGFPYVPSIAPRIAEVLKAYVTSPASGDDPAPVATAPGGTPSSEASPEAVAPIDAGGGRSVATYGEGPTLDLNGARSYESDRPDPGVSADTPEAAAPEPGTPVGRPALDLSGARIDTASREAPAFDQKRSRLVDMFRLGSAAVQGLGAIVGGDVGMGVASAASGASEGLGAVQAADKKLFETERDAYREWLDEAQTQNRRLDERQALEGYRAETNDYVDAREADQEQGRYARGRADTLSDRADSWKRADGVYERTQTDRVADREDRQTEQRERDAVQFERQRTRDRENAALRRAERDRQFQHDKEMVQFRARFSTSTSGTDPAGASVAIAALDDEMQEVERELARVPAGRTGAEDREHLRGRLDDLRKERRDRVAKLRNPDVLEDGRPERDIDSVYTQQDPANGPTFGDLLDAAQYYEDGEIDLETYQEVARGYQESPNSYNPRPLNARPRN